jgi:hypothetical protein
VTSSWIFPVSFFAILAGGAPGMSLRVRLPKENLGAETREMIRMHPGSSRRHIGPNAALSGAIQD